MNTAMGGAHHSQLGNSQANTHKSGHNQTQQSAQAFAGLINEKLTQTTHKASGSTNVDSTFRFQNSVHSSHSANADCPLDAESELLQTLRKKLNQLKRSL
jgi:hypothetical protein